MTSSSFFKECIYTFNHAFFSGRPLSNSFPLRFLLMGIGFSFLVCTIWPFLVRNDYLLWEYLCFLFGIHTFWPFLLRNSDRERQVKLISSFSTSIISHVEIFLWQLYMTSLWEGQSSLSVTQTSLAVNNNIGEYNLFYSYYTIFL